MYCLGTCCSGAWTLLYHNYVEILVENLSPIVQCLWSLVQRYPEQGMSHPSVASLSAEPVKACLLSLNLETGLGGVNGEGACGVGRGGRHENTAAKCLTGQLPRSTPLARHSPTSAVREAIPPNRNGSITQPTDSNVSRIKRKSETGPCRLVAQLVLYI